MDGAGTLVGTDVVVVPGRRREAAPESTAQGLHQSREGQQAIEVIGRDDPHATVSSSIAGIAVETG